MSSSKQQYQEALEDKKQLSDEIEKLKSKNQDLSEKVRLVADLKPKQKNSTLDSYIKVKPEAPENFCIQQKDLLVHMMEKIEDLLNCPILLIPIQKPMILPSGHTVEEVVIQNLIDKRSYDPYDNSKMCEDLIHNRFFNSLKELYESVKEKMSKAETIENNSNIKDSKGLIKFLQVETDIELSEDNLEDSSRTQNNSTQ